jgi:antitoxin FitA
MTPPRNMVLAKRKQGPYRGDMSPNLLVRSVPADTHATLVRRAASEGKSLQEYVLGLLKASADKPAMAEVMAEIQSGVKTTPNPAMNTEEIVARIRAVRDA